jgi:hypothetical protein
MIVNGTVAAVGLIILVTIIIAVVGLYLVFQIFKQNGDD